MHTSDPSSGRRKQSRPEAHWPASLTLLEIQVSGSQKTMASESELLHLHHTCIHTNEWMSRWTEREGENAESYEFVVLGFGFVCLFFNLPGMVLSGIEILFNMTS